MAGCTFLVISRAHNVVPQVGSLEHNSGFIAGRPV